ncbi:3'(2'),5'-bisphosphate nucleotidase CysQ [Lutibaculum baratangense]|uniref:Inositol monophosphatase family protein n=1 Tax=Lutibaculum baratangense AMV1 TaxID=631454 RepID=V4QYZ7_9HYPH|nr:3'(2'),5'-bisphosphate nucleotidase CysQ [Lutibaculum baratangense]ESR24952.1 inositol monophosphatase family protein [Lutibaculum baratangense AMV1]
MADADLQDLDLLTEAVAVAADVARGFFGAGPRSWTKGDDSPVTEADIAVDRLLFESLRSARPAYGWLSEEREDDPRRLGCDRIFVVDPIDGTRAFIAGESGWVISAAVVEAGVPRAGILIAPVTGETWTATLGGGSRRNGLPLAVADRRSLSGAHLATTKKMAKEIGLEDDDRVRRTYDRSLARRIALVAGGTYDAAIASRNAADWDLAAAALILTEAGGRLTDFDGRPLVFNRHEPRHPPLVGAAPLMHAALLERHRRTSPVMQEGDR